MYKNSFLPSSLLKGAFDAQGGDSEERLKLDFHTYKKLQWCSKYKLVKNWQK